MEEIKTKSRKVIVPAGKYFLGDPCYSVPNHLWDSLLRSCNFFKNPIGEVEGHNVLGFTTYYGDGLYRDNFENEFPVDAGLIGLVPVALMDMVGFTKNYPDAPGIWVTFEYPTVCETDGEVLTFGQHEINTAI